MSSLPPTLDAGQTNHHLLLLQERLTALNASELTIQDESHLHAGHAGNQGGASHFRATIVDDLLRDLIPYPIHALALTTRAPSKGNP